MPAPIAGDVPGATVATVAHRSRCRTRNVHGHKRRVCAPATITIATLRQTFTTRGGAIVLHVKLTRAGRKIVKQLPAADKAWKREQLALDRAYYKKHHRKRRHHGRPPGPKLTLTIRFTPA